MSNLNIPVNGFKQRVVYPVIFACGLLSASANAASISELSACRPVFSRTGIPTLLNPSACIAAANAQGANAVELGLGIASRLNELRNANTGGSLNVSSLSPSTNKTAAGDDELMDNLGVFLNGGDGFGNRKNTARAIGYDVARQDATLGVDYKFSDNFLLGTAFGYSNTFSTFNPPIGNLNSDSYVGSLYGSYFHDSGLFVDGILSGAGLDYSSFLGIANNGFRGKNQGTEFDVSMTTGYNYSKGGLTLTPQVRVEHISTHISSLDEVPTNSVLSVLATHINAQDIESLKTGLGGQVSYAISVPWGVIQPTARAEWVHEFQNDSRAIGLSFLKDPTQTRFFALTDKPDRDYVILSTGVSTQFAHGISAFVNYETLQGQNYINNHTFSGGVRLELDF